MLLLELSESLLLLLPDVVEVHVGAGGYLLSLFLRVTGKVARLTQDCRGLWPNWGHRRLFRGRFTYISGRKGWLSRYQVLEFCKLGWSLLLLQFFIWVV